MNTKREASLSNSRFLRACRREPVDATPIWLMRQAGRYMANYRALRAQHSILEMIRSPELSAEVTLQPVQAFDLDAAIIFADILTLPAEMGLDLEFISGRGPVIHNPIRSRADVDALKPIDPSEALAYTLDAIRLTVKELDGRIPLIGFSGAPFTLACYAIEGQGSKEYLTARAFMLQDPAAWDALMTRLADTVASYLIAQAVAGASALQLFDSWAGLMGREDYRRFVLPYSKQVLDQVRAATDVPLIHFATDSTAILDLIAEAGGDVIGVDWRLPLDQAWDLFGQTRAIQGNLDPARLLGPTDELKRAASMIIDAADGRPGHIFNLGHGINKSTPPERVAELVDFVHRYSAGKTAAQV